MIVAVDQSLVLFHSRRCCSHDRSSLSSRCLLLLDHLSEALLEQSLRGRWLLELLTFGKVDSEEKRLLPEIFIIKEVSHRWTSRRVLAQKPVDYLHQLTGQLRYRRLFRLSHLFIQLLFVLRYKRLS